jgi:hypothetical protein
MLAVVTCSGCGHVGGIFSDERRSTCSFDGVATGLGATVLGRRRREKSVVTVTVGRWRISGYLRESATRRSPAASGGSPVTIELHRGENRALDEGNCVELTRGG